MVSKLAYADFPYYQDFFRGTLIKEEAEFRTFAERASQFIDTVTFDRLTDEEFLKRSGITRTRVGTGIIRYTAPYAKRQYFCGNSSGQRGRKWVRRMWTSKGKKILKDAQKMINRGR